MGALTPGASYVYERANGKIYAREIGKTERTIIGYDANLQSQSFTLWNEMIREAEHNPSLQKALDSAIMIYRLSTNDPL